MADPVVSHGRGGTGNISSDSTSYTDGEIVREGPAGEPTTSGAYSTGRGGQGNIGPGTLQSAQHDSQDVIPEAAMRSITDDRSYHVGRGGEGNAHLAHPAEKSKAHDGLADKLKHKLFKPKKTDARTES